MIRFSILLLCTGFFFPGVVLADRTLSLQLVLDLSTKQSLAARTAQLRHENELLAYENYKKSFLPSLSFQVSPFNFNHSLQQLQNADNGAYTYINDYKGNSSAGLTIQQRIGVTGGTLSANSRLAFLREFSRDRNSFSTQILTLGYTQPLWGGFRSHRLENTIQYKKQRLALRNYCSELSQVENDALTLYLQAHHALLCKNAAIRISSMEDTLSLIAKKKHQEGIITTYELEQIHLLRLQTELDLTAAERDYRLYCRRLADFLNIDEMIQIGGNNTTLPPEINEQLFLDKAHSNNPSALSLELQLLEAESEWFEVKKATRFNRNVSLNYGMNQYAETFVGSYRHPSSSQSVLLSLQIPIFQWGINRNQLKIAENKRESILLQSETEKKNFETSLHEQLYRYHVAAKSTSIARKAYDLSCKQLSLLVKKFQLGNVSSYELTQAKKEQLSCMETYSENLQKQYISYFLLRQLSLYDFERRQDLIDTYIPPHSP